MYDETAVRRDFPILSRTVNGKPLVYLDNAATSQKPLAVIDALVDYYSGHNANVHRGVHQLSEEATSAYELAREKVAGFVGASSSNEIVFVRNTTEAINLVAHGWGLKNLGPGDEIVLSDVEHHSNLVPWQMLCQRTGSVLRFLPMNGEQTVDRAGIEDVIGPRTRLVSLVHVSNAFGGINPVEEVVAAARRAGALVMLDGAQSVPHMPVNVQDLDIDFLAFSGHKMCAPMGIGALWARESILEGMDPFLGGGDMIRAVWYDHAEYNTVPYKFEAGTPNVADAVGLGAAIDYLSALGMQSIRDHERDLTAFALERFAEIEDVTVYGPRDAGSRGGVVSFNLNDVHPHDVGTILDTEGIAIRAGHHCCNPAMRKLGISGTARASFYLYTTRAEVDLLVGALTQVRSVFARA